MKILVVLSRIPYPLEKGDKLRAYYQIRELSKSHDVYIAALYHGKIPENAFPELSPYCRKILFLKQSRFRSALNMLRALLKGIPIQCGYFYSNRNRKRLERIIASVQPDVIYCQLFRMAEYVRNCKTSKILDYQDAFSMGLERRAERAFFPVKQIMRMESRRIAKYEVDIFDDFDAKTMISEVDSRLIKHPMNHEIKVVPNGVDFSKFAVADSTKTHDIIFSGNMNYAPNVDAAVYLCKSILPELKKKRPDIKVMIAGADPAQKVRALQNENVTVTGWVPSMSDCYAKCRVFVAPMRLGTGLQNKLLEAMSMKLPCVTSPLAAKPLDASPGEVLQCHTTLQYMEAIDRLLSDEKFYQEISQNGNAFVHNKYDWTNATQILEDLMKKVAGR